MYLPLYNDVTVPAAVWKGTHSETPSVRSVKCQFKVQEDHLGSIYEGRLVFFFFFNNYDEKESSRKIAMRERSNLRDETDVTRRDETRLVVERFFLDARQTEEIGNTRYYWERRITFVQLGDGRRGRLEFRPHLLRVELLLIVQLILIIGLGFERLDRLLLPIAVPEVHYRIILAPVVVHRCRSRDRRTSSTTSTTARSHTLVRSLVHSHLQACTRTQPTHTRAWHWH